MYPLGNVVGKSLGYWQPAVIIRISLVTDHGAENQPIEPPRVYRRLQLLRGWSYDEENIGKIFT
jgi:hypothetical protein